MDRKNLALKASLRFISGIIILSGLIFIPAGTVYYRNGWIYLGILSFSMISILVYLLIKDPRLLEKRINYKEKEEKQKFVQKSGSIFFVASFISAGFDFRYGWSDASEMTVIAAIFFVLSGFVLFFFVIRENSYASRVIEVQQDQKVIDTGLYSLIRHPMYFSNFMIFIFSPLVLGSYYAVIPMLYCFYIFPVRILNEEDVLKKNLPGYDEYMKKVKYRLLPYVW